jgi:hypothetical protein
MKRPKAEVLPASSVVPDRNLVVPPPTRFTHTVTAAQPYYYADPRSDTPADGEFAPGTKVALLGEAGSFARVVDARGLYVVTSTSGLQPLG